MIGNHALHESHAIRGSRCCGFLTTQTCTVTTYGDDETPRRHSSSYHFYHSYLSIYLYIYLSSIHLSIHLSIYLSNIYLPIYLSRYLVLVLTDSASGTTQVAPTHSRRCSRSYMALRAASCPP